MPEVSDEKLAFVSGRLMGLSSTVRYNLPDELREELKELAQLLYKQKLPT